MGGGPGTEAAGGGGGGLFVSRCSYPRTSGSLNLDDLRA